MNGNKLKGNAQRKGGRRRKEVYADFDPNTDKYGRVVNLLGGRNVSVLILNDLTKTPIQVSIRGIHYNRVWYKKDDLVIVRDNDTLWGKVPDEYYNKVKNDFDKFEGSSDASTLIFRNDDEIGSDDEIDDDGVGIPPQPALPSLDVISDDINIDDI